MSATRRSTQIGVGSLIDRKFELRRMLGEGGMGTVWAAQNTLVQKQVAIKFLRPEHAQNTQAMARFRSEATAAGRIGSPHICDILDLGGEDQAPYIVMEMLRGRDLDQLLTEVHQLDPGLAVLIVRQALEGLQAAHQAGIIHRDLKPENIFLHEPEPGRLLVKLMDFGISKFREPEGRSHTGTGVIMGTPE